MLYTLAYSTLCLGKVHIVLFWWLNVCLMKWQASIQIFRPLVEVTSEGFAQALVFAIRDIHRLLVWMSTPSELPYGELSYRPSDQTSVVEGARYVSASRSRSAISLAHFLHTDVPYDDLFNDEQKQSGFPMLEGYTYQLRQSIQISHLTFFHSHSPMGLCYDRYVLCNAIVWCIVDVTLDVE